MLLGSPSPEPVLQSHSVAPAPRPWALYLAAAVAAFSGIAYELLLATYASFLLGASIFQYSLVVSLMMASMGLGALLADKVKGEPVVVFLWVELTIAFLAAVTLPLLYWSYAREWFPGALLLSSVVLLGIGIGMEIPILNRVAGGGDRLPRILFYDYLGGFLGGLCFPLLLVPRMSLFQIGGLLALVNVAVGALFVVKFHRSLKPIALWVGAVVCLGVLSASAYRMAEPLRMHLEKKFFNIQYAP